MKYLVIFIVFVTTKTFCQNPPQFDSADFFIRNKIRMIVGVLNAPNPLNIHNPFYTFSFDPQHQTVNGKSLVKRDTTSAKSVVRSNDSINNFFDNKKRLVKTLYAKQSHAYLGATTVIYKYCDDNSFRLDSVIRHSNQVVYVTKYIYEKSILKRSISVAYSKYYKDRNNTIEIAPFANEKTFDGQPYETNLPEEGVINADLPNEYYMYLMNTKSYWPDANNGSSPVSVSLYEYYPDNKPKRVITFDLTGTYRGSYFTDFIYDSW